MSPRVASGNKRGSGVLSQASSNIRVTGQAQGVDRQGAQAGEVGRAVAGADLAVVFAEGHVADPVQAVSRCRTATGTRSVEIVLPSACGTSTAVRYLPAPDDHRLAPDA